MNPLINELKKFGNISLEIENELSIRIKKYDKKKGDHFLKQGQINSNIFVIERGQSTKSIKNRVREKINK